MLNLIKRASRRRSSQNTDELDCTSAAAAAAAAQKRHSLRSTTSFCDEVFLEQLEEELATAADCCDAVSCSGGSLSSNLLLNPAAEDIFKYNSRLSMTLAAIVDEPNCLSYFVQYLEARDALPLIKFYMDIENFRRVALAQIERKEREEATTTTTTINSTTTTVKEDNVDIDEDHDDDDDDHDDVPELKTLCDLSMRKPLTDDEKSRIYAETNKAAQMKQQRHTSQLSLCSAGSMNEAMDNGTAISAASVRDAIAIYQKYLIVNARQFIELPIGILAHISLLLCNNGNEMEQQLISATCFDEARDYVLSELERMHVQGFLQSGYYCKYCVELIEGATSSTHELNIYDVLYSELALFYFTEYLEQHNERKSLEFWITAINFRKSFASSTPISEEQAKSDAMIIYERYFSLQSECRLWLSDRLRLRVEQAICAPGQLAYAFDLALLVTAKYLEEKYFNDFLKSNIFDNYVNELRAKQQQTNNSNSNNNHNNGVKLRLKSGEKQQQNQNGNQQQRHRKALSMSDCSPISQHNTLLAAMDNVKPSTNMNIDARQLTNPQLLWQRPKATTLKFGSVNSLGRYERDFEALDAITTRSQAWSKAKNAMRKLVNLPEDNVQEEIAWHVAEMIIKDVTNVTLNGGDGGGAAGGGSSAI